MWIHFRIILKICIYLYLLTFTSLKYSRVCICNLFIHPLDDASVYMLVPIYLLKKYVKICLGDRPKIRFFWIAGYAHPHLH